MLLLSVDPDPRLKSEKSEELLKDSRVRGTRSLFKSLRGADPRSHDCLKSKEFPSEVAIVLSVRVVDVRARSSVVVPEELSSL